MVHSKGREQYEQVFEMNLGFRSLKKNASKDSEIPPKSRFYALLIGYYWDSKIL
jgi:hypothetical protein